MLESTACRARAKEKLEEAKRDPQHQRRHRNAAEAWLMLAKQTRQAEVVRRHFLLGSLRS
jgi:hypothetical protein